jgi:hypothetical protein
MASFPSGGGSQAVTAAGTSDSRCNTTRLLTAGGGGRFLLTPSMTMPSRPGHVIEARNGSIRRSAYAARNVLTDLYRQSRGNRVFDDEDLGGVRIDPAVVCGLVEEFV